MSEAPSHAAPPIEPQTAPVPPPPPAPVRTGLATAALVLGIIAIPSILIYVGPLLGVLAVILGIVAIIRAGRQPQRHGGMARGAIGVALGAISVLLAAVVLMVLARGLELHKRSVSQMFLRSIGQAVHDYARQNAGAFPPNLDTLVNEGMCTADQLTNPSSGHVPPARDYSYVYYAALPDFEREPDWILAYGDPAHHAGEGANILYVDGRVEFVTEPRLTQQIENFSASYESQHGRPPTIIPPR
jgi:prepilin-type processing-associated H-X9-DG protein